jgi:hypothetical protein
LAPELAVSILLAILHADGLPSPSPFRALSIACGAIPESFPLLTPMSLSRVAHEKCEPGSPIFLKNNIKSQPAWQEIVDFSSRTTPPSARRFHWPSKGYALNLGMNWTTRESKLPLGKAHRLSISAAFSASSSSI